ncbi:alkaline phosphatase [Dysgonomonas sp. PH5-45]|uniref:alkaline phosphatase n=1 Tax=unclassified Dysgonomonas TaxID=2630389 RepID=UPI002474610F|nr:MULTISPECIES: alkaline phosphatase [unclassified Dysgonomonas]MDH6354838.1 alkaline phosphatase [Dysgonomonas sp. PH5-45]MDH6387737.1 alkaline phosphatase [Dysgonomonas sp. PH5-37]
MEFARKFFLSLAISLLVVSVFAQGQYRRPVKPTKNVIVMIPDGTSIGVVSAARWYQIYNKQGGERLAIDPYLCGTVKTFSSNAPIGDSAPTTSCYMTGMPQRTSNVAIYPVADPGNDLVTVDPAKAYQPLATILEAARRQLNKATGLVATVEFPHATPADCAAHYYNRGKYDYLASQIAYQDLDVMFGGGNNILTNDIKQRLKTTGTRLVQNSLKDFRDIEKGSKAWALFCDREHPYDLDRDTTQIPSLAEMTGKAIDLLSGNENGFFLMVEGSKVDWAAHANDAVGCITEYLAFDRAVGVAMDFALKNGETTVIVLPDHGNSGFSIGNNRSTSGYDKKTFDELFANVSQYKKTSEGLEQILLTTSPEDIKTVVKQYTDIDLTEEEYSLLLRSRNYKKAANYMEASGSVSMGSTLVKIMNSRTYFGFTTGGHTGEEVFLAAYHPEGDIPVGMNTNVEINQYLFDAVGLTQPLEDMTAAIFTKHRDVFKGLDFSINKTKGFPELVVKKGKNVLIVPAFKSIAFLNGKQFELGSVTVYIDKNDTFYLPRNLADKL